MRKEFPFLLGVFVGLPCLLPAQSSAFEGDLWPIANGPKEIVLRLNDKNLVFKQFRFGRAATYNSGVFVPELAFQIENTSATRWDSVKLKVIFGALCGGQPKQFEQPVGTYVNQHTGAAGDKVTITYFREVIEPLRGKLNGCKVHLLDVGLLNDSTQASGLDGGRGEPVDFIPRLQVLQVDEEKRAREEAARRAERAERQRQEAIEQKKLRAAEREAKEAEDAALRARCLAVYRRTSNKRLVDLTVKESEQIQACKVLGLYPPD